MLKDRTITTYQDNVKALSDTPSSDGVTAEQLKNIFDGRTDQEIKTSINGIINGLTATTDGASGADNVGATPLKDGGAETVQGQLEELYNEKSSKLDLASSADGNSGADNIGSTALKSGGSTTVQGQLEELEADKADKISGKGLSANDFTDTYKTKLDGVEENANNYVLPVPTATQIGGVKAGVSIEIEADGTINGLAAPAPDLVARANIAQEIIDRQNADQVLTDRIATEETTRSTADSNLQTQITANKNAVNVNISEAVRTLYGLTTDNANVDKALQKLNRYNIVSVTSSQNWTVPAGVKLVDVFLCGGGGGGGANRSSSNSGGGGGGGECIYIPNMQVTPGNNINCIVGSGGNGGIVDNTGGDAGGDTKFGNFVVQGGKGALAYKDSGNAGNGGDGYSGGGGATTIYSNVSDGGEDGMPGSAALTPTLGSAQGKGIKSINTYINSFARNPFDGLLYGSGGGGGAKGDSSISKAGGIGGSGAGNGGLGSIANNPPGAGGSGMPNRGGGGGGGGAQYSGAAAVGVGGKGGSGVIMIGYFA